MEAHRNGKSTFEAAYQSGAQIITTDYYLPSTHFKSEYQIGFADNTYFRINPVYKNRESNGLVYIKRDGQIKNFLAKLSKEVL